MSSMGFSCSSSSAEDKNRGWRISSRFPYHRHRNATLILFFIVQAQCCWHALLVTAMHVLCHLLKSLQATGSSQGERYQIQPEIQEIPFKLRAKPPFHSEGDQMLKQAAQRDYGVPMLGDCPKLMERGMLLLSLLGARGSWTFPEVPVRLSPYYNPVCCKAPGCDKLSCSLKVLMAVRMFWKINTYLYGVTCNLKKTHSFSKISSFVHHAGSL